MARRYYPGAVAEPRNHLIDATRALSVLVVVVFHAGLWQVSYAEGRLTAHVVSLGPAGWVLSWFVMVIPLFFIAGGYAHAVVVDNMAARGTSYAHYLTSRARRLLGPLVMFVTLWAVVFSALAWTWSVGISNAVAHNLTKLLWFLATYLVIVLLAPMMVLLHDRCGVAVPLALLALAAVVDVVTMRTGVLDIRYANLVLVWLGCHQLGIGLHRGWLRTGAAWRAWTAIAGGAASTVALIALGWPVTAVGFGDRPLSNLQPPTAAMVTLGVAQLGVLGLLSRRRLDWLERPRVQQALAVLNALVMSIYLWHMPCVAAAMALGLLVGWLVPAAATVATFPLVVLPVALALVALVVPLAARVERRLIPPLGQRQHGMLAVAACLVLLVGIVLVWRYGVVVHPERPYSSVGVLLVWLGAALLARASNWRYSLVP